MRTSIPFGPAGALARLRTADHEALIRWGLPKLPVASPSRDWFRGILGGWRLTRVAVALVELAAEVQRTAVFQQTNGVDLTVTRQAAKRMLVRHKRNHVGRRRG